MTDPDVRRPRADAVRSRDAIIGAAESLFAEEGPRAPLDRVAERAGVGSATLHRHFSGRAELLSAVVQRVNDRLAELGRAEFESSDDPDALWRWLDVVVRHCAEGRSIADAAPASALGDDGATAALLAAGQPLLDRARAHGSVVDDASVVDLLRLVNAIAPAAGGDPDEAVRLFAVVRRGMTADPGGDSPT